jgi:hypothetical protein
VKYGQEQHALKQFQQMEGVQPNSIAFVLEEDKCVD